jgi:hypothetical protein
MMRMVSAKNVALAVLGAAVAGLGAVVAVDHTVGATPSSQAASLVASTSTTPAAPLSLGTFGRSGGAGYIAGYIAGELGVTPATLKADIKNGKTLDQIAGPAHDASAKAAALTALGAELQKMVSKGVISPSQKTSLLADAQDAINQIFAAHLGVLFSAG